MSSFNGNYCGYTSTVTISSVSISHSALLAREATSGGSCQCELFQSCGVRFNREEICLGLYTNINSYRQSNPGNKAAMLMSVSSYGAEKNKRCLLLLLKLMCTVAFGQFGEESRATGANGESQRAAQGREEAAGGAVRGVSP